MSPHSSCPRTRLYLSQPLGEGARIMLEDKQAHYLSQVMRRKVGDSIALFNGDDGEWQAVIEEVQKKTIALTVQQQLRPQKNAPDIWLLCAPLKNARTEWVIEKATELGVARICPVTTQFTVIDRINENRLRAIAVEAAEQCERLDIPEINALLPLSRVLGDWPAGRALIYGDESGASGQAKELLPTLPQGGIAVLIGPEGGFSGTELELLRNLPYVSGMCMGPRVMRADTAAIAALTLMQAWCGDWKDKPEFRNA